MTRTRVGGQIIEGDTGATRELYGSYDPLSPSCCVDCAVFDRAITSAFLPAPLTEALAALGVDARRPVELWGASDSGFLQCWYPFIGTCSPGIGPDTLDAGVEVPPDVRYLVVDSFPGAGDSAGPGKPVAQFAIEVTIDHSERLASWAQEFLEPS